MHWKMERGRSRLVWKGALMIKRCLYLRHQSNKAYETLRESGCISLPSQRTLRDYSNAVKARAGFSMEMDQQLLQAAELTEFLQLSPSSCASH